MKSALKSLEQCFAKGNYGLSARRLWEHTELGQINSFSKAISQRSELNNAADFIDVVRFDDDTFTLAGFTLAELQADQLPANSRSLHVGILQAMAVTDGVDAFIKEVAGHLSRCAERQALRNQHHPFLPSAQATDVFGVSFIFSTLQRRLRSLGKFKAGGAQWFNTIENF